VSWRGREVERILVTPWSNPSYAGGLVSLPNDFLCFFRENKWTISFSGLILRSLPDDVKAN
jgi:hypothetical protein